MPYCLRSMKTKPTDRNREEKLRRRAQLDHARRVAEENERRFDRLFDQQGFDPDNFNVHSD